MEWKSEKSIENAYQLRKLITETCERTNKVLLLLPKHKDFPEFEDFMHQYWFIYLSNLSYFYAWNYKEQKKHDFTSLDRKQ